MSVCFYQNRNDPYYYQNFRGTPQNAPELINVPIEKVENVINNTVDTFVKTPEDEEKKKSRKTAITAGSTVLVLSALVALLNPKFSGKLVNKLKTMSSKANANVQKNKDNIVKTGFYKTCEKAYKGIADIFQFTNTVNATKDLGFKWLCTAEKFNGVKNETFRNILKKCDFGFRKIMTGIHNSITNFFDRISKGTVYGKYKKASKNMKSLNDLFANYKTKLSPAEQSQFEAKMNEIKNAQAYFSKNNTAQRLKSQENSMANLEKDFKDKLFNNYLKNFQGRKSPGTFKQKMSHNVDHVRNNMSFWAEDMLLPERNAFELQGKNAVDVLVGDGKGLKGKYNELIDIISPHLSKEEKGLLESSLRKTGKKLRKANHSECVEYFDKKRDLTLGGAPTDIVTGLGLIGLSGIAIGSADTKEDRISRALTLGFPAVAGVGASLVLTAMLFTGVQGMICGSLASAGLGWMGSAADKAFNPKRPAELIETNNVEVMNA